MTDSSTLGRHLFHVSVLPLTLALHVAAAQGQAASCDAATFAKLDLPATRIVSATSVNDDKRVPGSHCVLRAAVNERTGTDGKPYAIGFEMRLPATWNGGYVDQLNGGNDGVVVPAYGMLPGGAPDNALARGYAVLSSDSGHDGQANPTAGLVGGNMFGFDEQARLDYGYTANVTLTPIAKKIIEGYYGRRPRALVHGGLLERRPTRARRRDAAREGVRWLSRRRPGLQPADGVAAARVGLAELRESRRRHSQARCRAPTCRRWPTACVSSAMCSMARPTASSAPSRSARRNSISRNCAARRAAAACLSDSQIAAWSGRSAGPKNKSGKALYSSWPYDAGLGSDGWRTWKLESPIPGFEGLPLIATLGAGSLAQVFTTPPTKLDGTPAGLVEFLRKFDFDRDAPKVLATTKDYPVSAMDFMAPTDWRNPKLAELKAAGGKVIVYHGAADGAFSLQATIDWYEKVRANNRGDASGFARFYPVPGMTHCGGGPSTDRFDLFSALVDWASTARRRPP